MANVRTHATLKERPIDRWRQEQGLLTPLPQAVRQTWKALLGNAPRPIPHESIQHPLSDSGGLRMNLQHQAIVELCHALKLECTAEHYRCWLNKRSRTI